MAGKRSQLTPLAARKKLLLMESELNRLQFIEAVRDWKAEFRRSKQQLASFGSLASLAGKVASVVPALGGLFSRRPAHRKKRRFSSLFNGMLTGTSLWLLLRSLRRRL